MKKIFIAWRSLSRRTKELAKLLKLDVLFLRDRPPYFFAALKTFLYLIKSRPSIVFVQLPQGPLLALTVLLKKFLRFFLVADVHTSFLVYSSFKEILLNKPFRNFLNACNIVIVHNRELKNIAKKEKLGKIVIVLPDPLPEFPAVKIGMKNDTVKYIFPASFHEDEPVHYLLEAFSQLTRENKNVVLYVTGDWRRRKDLLKYKSDRILFTGFLPVIDYKRLLMSCDVVIGLTIREYTFLSSAAEGLAAGKVLILSNTRTLQRIFYKGAIFVNPLDPEDILRGLKKVLDKRVRKKLEKEIEDLRAEYTQKVNKKLELLNRLLMSYM